MQESKDIIKNNDNNKYKLKFAMHDHMHCITPGLFRSLKKGDRKKLKLDIIHIFGNESDLKKIEFKGPEPLGVDDLRVLQGLVALCGKNKNTDFVTTESKSDIGISIKNKMDISGEYCSNTIAVAKGSFRELAKEIGYTQNENTTIIQKSIERLCTVTVFLEFNKTRIMCHLISTYGSSSENGKLFVGLNPIITKAIFTKSCYTRIDMNEVRLLQSDAARLIHQRLCAWLNSGEYGTVNINTVVRYVWPEQSLNKNTEKTRISETRKAIKSLETIHWKIKETSNGIFSISRPHIQKEEHN